ncbi:hypothetical protein M441DRAFT_55450 [Trichoderma asperellum CBS 433.97]|uniref:VanZ-like domain-containing protein n=1 Tax=Trichoderma asperellum (strain ATCC 204424 / CBS 433.97 / NBRC 101777) TaxID=1042311 RepID=A0A2T3ZHX8_TRIA4|nr:hypothetical protein M441DRAFT_55450 [Trichoderma asperellum CBS 433.97]PTB44402.1 hypothetical protein M441DRAFT_55450 [Trichoderma asperellum CBS 433.97]
MRIRLPFAGVFLLLLLLAGYAGLSTLQLGGYVNDKVLHFVTFFLLTIVFYWIVDTSRRRTLNMTILVCTVILGIGSEFVQSFLPNDRDFDLYDIVANIIGSLLGAGICAWYHKRMLERKRQRKHYDAVPGEDTEDVELGDGQESGILSASTRSRTLEEEVDNWDENEEDNWDDDNALDTETPPAAAANGADAADSREPKKRTD